MKKIHFVFLLFITACAGYTDAPVKIGAELLFEEHIDLLQGKRVGLVTNHTGILPDGRHLADVLHEHEALELTALYAPEHGIRGDATHAFDHSEDSATGLQVYSLYGDTRKPTPDMLDDIDVLIFDIQDVGARFYTYISTMNNTMEAAAENGKKFIVLDRPNPITGVYVDGTILDPEFRSFIGIQPIPVAHGMTVGELAIMVNEEGWLESGVKADLTVIQMQNYRRSMWYDQTELPWVKPSPNMLRLSTAIVYPATCFFEGTNVSDGRGTDHPFEWFGAPWMNGEELAKALNVYELPGVVFEPIAYTPGNMVNGVRISPKFMGEVCYGVGMNITDRNAFQPVSTGVYILSTIYRLYSDEIVWRENWMDLLWGTDHIRTAIQEGIGPTEIVSGWQEELEEFLSVREKYLLY